MTGAPDGRRRAKPGEREMSMTLRKRTLASCLVIVLCAAGQAGAVGLRVTGGYTRIAYGDYNEFVDGVNDLIAADPAMTGELGSIHWIPEIGIEATHHVIPTLSIGAGAGMLWGSSSFEFTAEGSTFSFEHAVKAYPITATLYADVPALLGFAKPFAFAGGGAYYTKLTFEERVGGVGDIFGYDADLSSWGFGAHGGVGLSFSVAPMVGIELAVEGRYAKITGFEGTATSTDGETADVILGFYEGDGGYMIYGPVGVDDAAGAGEGSVDLTGYGISLGVHVSF